MLGSFSISRPRSPGVYGNLMLGMAITPDEIAKLEHWPTSWPWRMPGSRPGFIPTSIPIRDLGRRQARQQRRVRGDPHADRRLRGRDAAADRRLQVVPEHSGRAYPGELGRRIRPGSGYGT